MQLQYNLHPDWHSIIFPADRLALWPIQDMCANLCLLARLESLLAQLLGLCPCSVFIYLFFYFNTPCECARQRFICHDSDCELFLVSSFFLAVRCFLLTVQIICPKIITSNSLLKNTNLTLSLIYKHLHISKPDRLLYLQSFKRSLLKTWRDFFFDLIISVPPILPIPRLNSSSKIKISRKEEN